MADEFTRKWITENAIEVCAQYEDGVLTLRGLHYQLVGLGMTNTIQHYKRVVSAMIKARRNGEVNYEQFSDHDRAMIGETAWESTNLDGAIESGKEQIGLWMTNHYKNRWEDQPKYVEVWIEKKALQGVFGPVCDEYDVALCPCKGYPSLTFLFDASLRFQDAEGRGQEPTMIYFGDHDPSGEDIPRSIRDNFEDDFGINVDVQVRALNKNQCEWLKLPAAPTKTGDSRSANFTGLGQVELDAVKPEMLRKWVTEAIEDNLDQGIYDELMAQQSTERQTYAEIMREFVDQL